MPIQERSSYMASVYCCTNEESAQFFFYHRKEQWLFHFSSLINFVLELQLIFICKKENHSLPFHLASEMSAEGVIYRVSRGLGCTAGGEKQQLDRA